MTHCYTQTPSKKSKIYTSLALLQFQLESESASSISLFSVFCCILTKCRVTENYGKGVILQQQA